MKRQMILAYSPDELAEALKLLERYGCTLENIKWSRALDVTTARYAIEYREPENMHLFQGRTIPAGLADYHLYKYFRIKDVIFNGPATIVFWADGEKTVVKCSENDVYDPEKGLAMAIAKRALGNKGKYYDIFKKWVPEDHSFEDWDLTETELKDVKEVIAKAKENIINELTNMNKNLTTGIAMPDFYKKLDTSSMAYDRLEKWLNENFEDTDGIKVSYILQKIADFRHTPED